MCGRLKRQSALEIPLSGRESICEALGSVPSSEEIKCQSTLCTVDAGKPVGEEKLQSPERWIWDARIV